MFGGVKSKRRIEGIFPRVGVTELTKTLPFICTNLIVNPYLSNLLGCERETGMAFLKSSV